MGTPEYISPEVLTAQEGGTHGLECDWWAMGVMMFEMIYGEVPFYSEQLTKMYGMIQNSANHLKFSEEAELSDDGKDFIRRWERKRESLFFFFCSPSHVAPPLFFLQAAV